MANKIAKSEAEEVTAEAVEETTVEKITNKTSKNEETYENSGKKIFKVVWNIVFWTTLLALFAIWITDFVRTKNDKKPLFCVKEKTYKYDDGKTEECIGLGYKVYKYKRTSIKLSSEFVPFFMSMEE